MALSPSRRARTTTTTVTSTEKCSIRDPLWKIRGRILEALTTVSVADLTEEPIEQPAVKQMTFVSSGRAPAQ